MKNKLAIFLSVFLNIVCLPAWLLSSEIDLAGFRICQTKPALPEIKVYVALRDTDGALAQGMTPQHFIAAVGAVSAPVSSVAPFDASDEATAYIFLVDISKSIRPAMFQQMRSGLIGWVDAMTEQDRATIITFGNDVTRVQDFTADKDRLKAVIEDLSPTDNYTRLHRAIITAHELGRRTDPGLPDRRAVIILSDGMEESTDGITREEVINRISHDIIPIYAIGFYNPPVSLADRQEKETHLSFLGQFARASGGELYRALDKPVDDIYPEIKDRIKQVWVVNLTCPDCVADGMLHRLQVTFAKEGRSVTDGAMIRLLPRIEPDISEPAPSAVDHETAEPLMVEENLWEILPLWAYYVCGGLLALLLVLIFSRKRDVSAPQDNRQGVCTAAEPGTDLPDTKKTKEIIPAGNDSVRQETSQPGLRISLVEIGRKAKKYDIHLKDRALIGRSRPQCQLAIESDTEISGVHCELYIEKGMVFVRDKGSKNGTAVNGVPITGAHRLRDRDVIGIGRTEMRLIMDEAV